GRRRSRPVLPCPLQQLGRGRRSPRGRLGDRRSVAEGQVELAEQTDALDPATTSELGGTRAREGLEQTYTQQRTMLGDGLHVGFGHRRSLRREVAKGSHVLPRTRADLAPQWGPRQLNLRDPGESVGDKRVEAPPETRRTHGGADDLQVATIARAARWPTVECRPVATCHTSGQGARTACRDV